MLTYAQQQELVNKKLAKASIDEENRLVTFKYARKVMYDYLWDKYPELLNCRGHVYCMDTHKLVIAAPTKTFNYLENGNWKDTPLNTKVKMYRKFNGFLANVAYHKGNMVVSTTGTTTSVYAKLARRIILENNPRVLKFKDIGVSDVTFSYEICDPVDPHIVYEKPGAYLLGYRFDNNNSFTPVGHFIDCTLQEALEYVKTDKGEGYMVYDEQMRCCKLKTPYYVGKKKLMRMNSQQVEKMYNNPQQISDALPEYWKFAPLAIKQFYTKEEWSDKTDQQRRVFLENTDEYGTK